MRKKEINTTNARTPSELIAAFAIIRANFERDCLIDCPMYLIDCERNYKAVVNISTDAMKEKVILSPIKIKKTLWATIQAKLQVSNFSPAKLFQKWKKD